MTQAIQWLHHLGFAHRDIKPQNFLLYSDNRLKLTDFGSAAPLVDALRVDPACCGTPVGTPDYIAPEVLVRAEAVFMGADARPYTRLVDWWSLGVTIYEIAAGEPPFFANTVSETYARIQLGNYKALSGEIGRVIDSWVRAIGSSLLTRRLLVASDDRRPPILDVGPRWSGSLPLMAMTPVEPSFSFDDSESTSSFALQSPPAEDDRWRHWYWYPDTLLPATPTTPIRANTYTAPKSTLRRRPRRAYQDMLACVGLSARKGYLAPLSSIADMQQWQTSRHRQLDVSVCGDKD
jgi:serine/threonine protein kinase